MQKTQKIVSISDAAVSRDPSEVLSTYSLGSCIAVCLYDATTGIGGMLHYQLPESKMEPRQAQDKPFMFADTGMTTLAKKMISMGANKRRFVIKIAGGAKMNTGPKGFDIGKRNYLAIRKFLWKKGMFIDAEDVGGSLPRNMYMNIDDGSVIIRSNGIEKSL